MSYGLPAGKALCLRTNNEDMTSYNGFRWPDSGHVTAPDWQPTPECGNGLHGLLWGDGDASLLNWDATAKWLVVEIDADSAINLDGKVKFPNCVVVHVGNRHSAATFIAPFVPPGTKVIGGTATAGDDGTATAGIGGTATAGYRGTTTAGDDGTATAGYRGTATAGYRGTATAGDDGTATAGDGGTATAGIGGTATAGYRGTATAGDGGSIIIQRWNGKRYKYECAEVGEGGLTPNQPYRLDNDGEFVEGDESEELEKK